MTKQELRKIYKRKRAALDAHERLRYDDLLLIRFQQLDYGNIQTVLTYWPMPHTAEPNTQLFSRYLCHIVPDITLAYPKITPDTYQMDAYAINDSSVYSVNKWGITEPQESTVVASIEIDLVFVPMFICDQIGQRVGYGKGFYDRYLSRCRQDVVKIGFSYFEPVDRITDTGLFDVPLNYCITPEAIYEF